MEGRNAAEDSSEHEFSNMIELHFSSVLHNSADGIPVLRYFDRTVWSVQVIEDIGFVRVSLF